VEVGKAIKALINAAGYNCTPDIIPLEVTGNAVVYHVISDVPLTSKERTSLVDSYRVQVDCYSHDYPGACALAAAIRTALDRKSGTYGQLNIDQVNFIDQRSAYDLELNETGIQMDFNIRIKL
jgi:hypothetical protein